MIAVKDITFQYSKKIPLLSEFSFELSTGHIYGLLGKNGAGKSTLLRNITGLLYPQNGLCEVERHFTHKRSVSGLKKMYYLPEQILLPAVSIKTYLQANAPFYPSFSRDIFFQILEDFEVPEIKLHHMSFGQKKKVALAFAIATNTKWLLLDEPTNGLDIPSKSTFRKVLANYLTENRGIVISTHLIADIDHVIDHLLIIEKGKLVLNSGIEELSNALEFKKVIQDSEEIRGVLYEEEFGFGKKVICKSDSNSNDLVDIELLFNGIARQESKLVEYLNK